MQGIIVARNVQLRDKIHMLKTIVDTLAIQPERFKKSLDDIANMARQDRNTVPHDMFWADDDGDGVEFNVINKLSFPPVKWSLAMFDEKYDKLAALCKEMDSLSEALQNRSLAQALMAEQKPNVLLSGLGLLRSPIPPPQDSLGSLPTPANPQIDDETPPSEQE